MIDKEGRKVPRFPVFKESVVRSEMLKMLLEEKAKHTGVINGIASGACGGDIIFHELCEEIGIQTHMYIPLPPEEFKSKSVSFAGAEWDIRFERLTSKIPVHISDENFESNIWAGTNLLMLKKAMEYGKGNTTLFALWDGKGGDGIGGSEHMVNSAKESDAEIKIIKIGNL
jgi:hypothetical protein